jgi:hypothetical protein
MKKERKVSGTVVREEFIYRNAKSLCRMQVIVNHKPECSSSGD